MRALLAVVAVLALRADLIDRVAVAVEKTVITESEILRQIRITALQNGEKLDFSPENRRATAERLVEQTLIRREIALSRYLPPGQGQELPDLYTSFKTRFGDEAKYREALGEYSLTDAEVRDAFRWQATLFDFVDLRFRPGIQIGDDEIRDYYTSHAGAKQIPLEEAREDIERVLTEERINAALDRWLGQARTQTRIVYVEAAFQP